MDKKRFGIQAAATLLQNANFKGFFKGGIYEGATKSVCVPGLNCYSCPGAVGACPIGSLQSFLSAQSFRFPYYVAGLLIFFGALLGRAICGFLCPMGFLQELIYMIPFPVKSNHFRLDKPLRKLKYAVLLLLVVALPICVKLTPFFCKYVCPSGTISGVLLAIRDSGIRRMLGGLFSWKVAVLVLIAAGSLMVFRPFCKYLCPLGAIYSPFNKIALFRMTLDKDSCVGCGECARVCRMCVNPAAKPNSGECIRCGDCVRACPENALKLTFINQQKKTGAVSKCDAF